MDLPHMDDLLGDDTPNASAPPIVPAPEPVVEPTTPVEPPLPPDPDPNPEDENLSTLELFLKQRGLSDGKTITYQNDDGVEEQIDFNTLPKDEQLEIIKSLTDPGLNDDEVNAISYLRTNKASFEQVINYHKQKAIDDYLAENPDAVKQQYYTVDEFTDDELYVSHLKTLYPNLTDEDYESELTSAKEKGESFDKKVEAIRTDFKDKEDKYLADQEASKVNQYNEFKNALVTSAGAFGLIPLDYTDPKTDKLVVNDDDKTKVLTYILDQDSNGESRFFKDLNDPDVLLELAWYRLFGQTAISEISKYWKDVLKETRPNNPKSTKTKDNTTVVKPDVPGFKEIVSGVNTPFTENQIKYETF